MPAIILQSSGAPGLAAGVGDGDGDAVGVREPSCSSDARALGERDATRVGAFEGVLAGVPEWEGVVAPLPVRLAVAATVSVAERLDGSEGEGEGDGDCEPEGTSVEEGVTGLEGVAESDDPEEGV